MTKPTVSAAGEAMLSEAPLTFDIKRGMYGTCKRIHGRIGLAGEVFAQAFFWDIEKKWDIEVFNADGSIGEYSIDVVDREQAIHQVQVIMDLEYSRNYVRRAVAYRSTLLPSRAYEQAIITESAIFTDQDDDLGLQLTIYIVQCRSTASGV
jgi:hypothetical protein